MQTPKFPLQQLAKLIGFLACAILITFNANADSTQVKLSIPSEVEQQTTKYGWWAEPIEAQQEKAAFAAETILSIEDLHPNEPLNGRTPLLLVHGWSPSGKPAPPGGGGWTNFRNYMANDTELNQSFKPYLVRYWSNAVSIKEIASQFRDALEANGLNEHKFLLIGHSMGGIVSRSLMNEHLFSTGPNAGQKAGENVKQLITLGSPHHGSPMANGPARDNKVSFLNRIYMSIIESAAFKDLKYNEVNRSDMLWDNFDGLFDYVKYPAESNQWLVNLNKESRYDSRTICYVAAVEGKFLLPPYEGTEEEYLMGAYLMTSSFGFENDGIVPISSAAFQGHQMKLVRPFYGYNHSEINVGKNGSNALFILLKTDLMPYAPLRITAPVAENLFIKGGSTYTIQWQSPIDISFLNIYYTIDNGERKPIAIQVDATSGKYIWDVPAINANNCRIYIENTSFTNENTQSNAAFTIYHNEIEITEPGTEKYVVWKKGNMIKWTQQGLGSQLSITYTDTLNQVEKTIAENVPTAVGLNQFEWIIDESYTPSPTAQLKLSLTDMGTVYGDFDNYQWISEPFILFGDPEIVVSPPLALTNDTISELLIASTYKTNWETLGEIGHVSIYLIDSTGEKTSKLHSLTTQIAFESKGTAQWNAPELHGDKYQLLAEAGPDSITVTASVILPMMLSVNSFPVLNAPKQNQNDVSLLPCFEFAPVFNPASYLLTLRDEFGDEKTYTSSQASICLPNQLAHELKPGKTYTIEAVEMFDGAPSYTTVQNFSTKAAPPASFQIIDPQLGEVLNDSIAEISWFRAIGASAYNILATHRKDTLLSYFSPELPDTMALVDLSQKWHRDTIKITVVATNQFGNSTASTYFFNTFKADSPKFEYNPKLHFQLNVYPNPFENSFNVVFGIPLENKPARVILSAHNLEGQQIGTIMDRTLPAGTYNLDFDYMNPTFRKLTRGIYLLQLNIDGISDTKRLIKK
jgi:pimeloyl-ACP methyl ester carboxylesterase